MADKKKTSKKPPLKAGSSASLPLTDILLDQPVLVQNVDGASTDRFKMLMVGLAYNPGGGSDVTPIDTTNPLPVASGIGSTGWTPYRNINLGTTGQVIKASAGKLGGYFITNTIASIVYVKLYNKATAPTQADTPILTLAIPATGGANLMASAGITFSTGISVRASTGIADNDTGAPSSNQVIFNAFYN